jgi:phosphate transport system substrate-binding protein
MKVCITCLFFLGLIYSCGPTASEKATDTATSGTITIAADEGLKPILDAELQVFESIYPDAHIHIHYTNEYDAIQLMCKDSARIAVVTRDLLPEEKAAFERDKITPRYSPFAYDAVALILNRGALDTIFSRKDLEAILSGKAKTWKDLSTDLPDKPFRVVFDDPKSGITRFAKDSLLHGSNVSNTCFAVKGNATVIEEVSKDVNTLGLIAVAWISDQDDSLMHSFSEKIRVASIIPDHPELAEAATMKPFQAYISLKQYPLWRKVQIISREPRVGLGTGFASFIASDKGQRIVLKSGLVPALAPIRIIHLNNN